MLRGFNMFLGVLLVAFWLLHVACPLFDQGPPEMDFDDSVPPPAVCICLNRLPAAFCFRGSSIKLVQPRGILHSRKHRILPVRLCALAFVLLLSGDVELNPGPGIGKLNFAQFNTQSVFGSADVDKPELLKEFVTDNNVDIFALSETWLRPDSLPATINSITPDGYTFMHVSRESGRGGGVGFIYRASLEFRRLIFQPFTSFEIIGAKLSLQSVSCVFINIYRPPSSSLSTFLSEFASLLEDIGTSDSEIFFSGDYNIHVDNSNCDGAVRFLSLLEIFGLKQKIDFPTHVHGHTLDLFICRNNSVKCPVSDCYPTCLSFSDHLACSCSVEIPTKVRPQQIRKKFRNFKNFDTIAFGNELLRSGLNYVTDISLELYVNVFNSTVSTLLDRFAPWKNVKCSAKVNQPFYTPALHDQKRIRSNLESRWRRHKTDENFMAYKQQAKHFAGLLRDAKAKYYRDLVSTHAGNSFKLWSVLNNVLNRSSLKILPACLTDSALASQFSEYFSEKITRLCTTLNASSGSDESPHHDPVTPPTRITDFEQVTAEEVRQAILKSSNATCDLDVIPTKRLKECVHAFLTPITTIVNKCFTEGSFPLVFKHALVSPLLKKLALPKDELSSYRPISHLNFVSKITERIIHSRLLTHLNSFPSFSVFQSAYRMFHSTETALLRVQNDLFVAMEQKRVSALVLLDLSAAFDTVDHNILTTRLSSFFGFGGRTLALLTSYLTNRTQSVHINDAKSTPTKVETGVPQGSVLGPLLFSLYLAPLSNILSEAGVSFHFYADDTQIYISFSTPDCTEALDHLSAVLEKVRRWFAANRLSLNPDKTEFIIIGSNQQRTKLAADTVSITVGNACIAPSNCVRNLGVMFDEELNMKNHVSKVCQVSFLYIRMLRRIRGIIDLNSAKLAANALVTSRIDYCNSLLYGINKGLVHRLQIVQNSLARAVVPSCRRYDHISPVLKQLHWLPVQQRIEFKVALITFKVLQCNEPSYLRELIQPVPVSARRSANKNLLVKPFVKSEMGRRAFSFSAPSVWNALPQQIRDSTTLPTFKNRLKTHLFPR